MTYNNSVSKYFEYRVLFSVLNFLLAQKEKFRLSSAQKDHWGEAKPLRYKTNQDTMNKPKVVLQPFAYI